MLSILHIFLDFFNVCIKTTWHKTRHNNSQNNVKEAKNNTDYSKTNLSWTRFNNIKTVCCHENVTWKTRHTVWVLTHTRSTLPQAVTCRHIHTQCLCIYLYHTFNLLWVCVGFLSYLKKYTHALTDLKHSQIKSPNNTKLFSPSALNVFSWNGVELLAVNFTDSFSAEEFSVSQWRWFSAPQRLGGPRADFTAGDVEFKALVLNVSEWTSQIFITSMERFSVERKRKGNDRCVLKNPTQSIVLMETSRDTANH